MLSSRTTVWSPSSYASLGSSLVKTTAVGDVAVTQKTVWQVEKVRVFHCIHQKSQQVCTKVNIQPWPAWIAALHYHSMQQPKGRCLPWCLWNNPLHNVLHAKQIRTSQIPYLRHHPPTVALCMNWTTSIYKYTAICPFSTILHASASAKCMLHLLT
jgi:hypothetical protein